MGLIKKCTKTSIQFLADDSKARLALQKTVYDLSGDYEFKTIDETFFTAVEFYLDLHLTPYERAQQVSEIIKTVEKNIED